MSMGYPASQGYTGNPRSPTPPAYGQRGGSGMGQGLSLVGRGLAAFGTMYSASQQAKSFKQSARAKEKEALAVRERNVWDQIRFNEDTRRLISTQRATYGEAGVTLEGAPMDLIASSKAERVLDRMQMAANATYEYQSLLADARELRKAGHASKVSGVIGAFSSFF